MSEVKTNQDLINDVFNDMINDQKGESQGAKPEGNINNNPANVDGKIQNPTENELEPADPNGLESTEGDNQVVENTTETDSTTKGENTEPNLFDDWDSDNTTTKNTDSTVPTVDYSEIAKELGLEDTSKESIVKAYTKLKEDAQAANEYKDLPSELMQAIELAKKGRDYKVLFSNESEIDHSKFDDRTLLLNQNQKYFTDPEGNVDTEALQEYVDDMTEIQQRIEAKKVRENIDEYNRVKKEEKIKQVYEKQQRAQKELQDVISLKNEVKGFKVKPEHKEEAFKKISTGEAIKEMFMKDDGSYDMNKLFETYFIVKNFDKMKSFLSRRATDEARIRDFNSVSNANPNVRQTLPEPGEKQTKDHLDLWMDELKAKSTGNIINN